MPELAQEKMADEMRRSAREIRNGIKERGDPTGALEVAARGNEAIADYIEGLECALAAERLAAERDRLRREPAASPLAALERAVVEAADKWRDDPLRSSDDRARIPLILAVDALRRAREGG